VSTRANDQKLYANPAEEQGGAQPELWGIEVVRLCWPKSPAYGNKKSNNQRPGPPHLVVPKEQNINVIENEIQWQTEYEPEDKAVDLVSRHPYHGYVEDEG
jgi:hypothetical protein